MAIRTVGVLGCGLMGAGIAQVSAGAGYRTIVREVDQPTIEKGLARIRKFLADGVEKERVTPEARDRTLASLEGTTRLEDLADADLVIEAVVENIDVKRAAYAEIERIVGAHTLIASNTSSLCVMELAAATGRPDRFVGLHFFNPVPLMKLVEVVRALSTTDDTYQQAMAFVQSLGKQAVAAPDRPGFIVNRLLIPYLLDAVRAYEQGLGTIEDIDAAMKLGCGHPMGPFTLLDFIGIDTTYYIANIMFEEFREPRFAPPAMMKRMVVAGRTGRKGGRGFYQY
ncbi:MAG TPA: 3-hydroxybutyryl-CoA dehydrogenase [Vicinamibacterales bacterium]|jgi:3-hydroxybutyryl-CoA dehydrogenase